MASSVDLLLRSWDLALANAKRDERRSRTREKNRSADRTSSMEDGTRVENQRGKQQATKTKGEVGKRNRERNQKTSFMFSYPFRNLQRTSAGLRSVHPGGNITLPCAVTAEYEISWYHQSSEEMKLLVSVGRANRGKQYFLSHIVDEDHYEVAGNTGLVIVGVNETDLGLYYCGGRNHASFLRFGRAIRLKFAVPLPGDVYQSRCLRTSTSPTAWGRLPVPLPEHIYQSCCLRTSTSPAAWGRLPVPLPGDVYQSRCLRTSTSPAAWGRLPVPLPEHIYQSCCLRTSTSPAAWGRLPVPLPGDVYQSRCLRTSTSVDFESSSSPARTDPESPADPAVYWIIIMILIFVCLVQMSIISVGAVCYRVKGRSCREPSSTEEEVLQYGRAVTTGASEGLTVSGLDVLTQTHPHCTSGPFTVVVFEALNQK
ncbi:hypothetical protein NFI96_015059 [Prochilodus magdalenae]|nr:hypothetical protein NFI96_015059 [Prochilodus magdalenae]